MEVDERCCPSCAETIKAAAVKCRHCGDEFAKKAEANKGFPLRWSLYIGALAAFVVSGMDLAGATPGSSRQTEGYFLTVLSIVLFVIGGLVQSSQRNAGDTRSDKKFWAIAVSITFVVGFFGLALS
jgi:hypothetical protein